MGYQNVEIPAVDFVLFTPTFTGITGGIDLTEITMADSTGADYDPFEMVSIQVMDETGAYTDAYTYSPAFYTHGWALNGSEIAPGDVVITAGRAFCVNNSIGDVVYMRVRGQVDLVNANLIPAIDFVLWGNASPVAVDLTDITMTDTEGADLDPFEMVSLQVMDETGAYTDAYTYSPAFYTYGWALDGVEVEPGDMVLQPGQSFCVNNSLGQALYFKGPNPAKYTLPTKQ